MKSKIPSSNLAFRSHDKTKHSQSRVNTEGDNQSSQILQSFAVLSNHSPQAQLWPSSPSMLICLERFGEDVTTYNTTIAKISISCVFSPEKHFQLLLKISQIVYEPNCRPSWVTFLAPRLRHVRVKPVRHHTPCIVGTCDFSPCQAIVQSSLETA